MRRAVKGERERGEGRTEEEMGAKSLKVGKRLRVKIMLTLPGGSCLCLATSYLAVPY